MFQEGINWHYQGEIMIPTKRKLLSLTLLTLPLLYHSVIQAAEPIDLNHQPITVMQSMVGGPLNLEEIKRTTFKDTVHIHLQQTYNNALVWGAQGIVHIPDGNKEQTLNALSVPKIKDASMDGTFYKGLKADLANTPSAALTPQQQQKALSYSINTYEQQIGGKTTIENEASRLIVYVDDANKAHWAYLVNFDAAPTKKGQIPAKPHFIIDAVSLKIYQQWDNIQTILESVNVDGGGFGGNTKMGKVIYDGLQDHLSKLRITRDTATNLCLLQNAQVKVKRCTDFWFGRCMSSVDFKLPCGEKDPAHNNVYWNGETDAVNGGYSPSNDALFNGEIINNMYTDWYKVPVLIENGKPMLLTMIVHLEMDNAYWDGKTMNFGDGIDLFYPLTSLGVAAHEISHGFTTQHSNLAYYGQSGGMNEAFSDMAAQAAEFYAYGKNSWQIGPEIFKSKGQALRYMDRPSKDCNGKKPGTRCSIDDASQYTNSLDVHFSSGVYNRAYYVLGTTKGWTPRKAFDVMLHANSHYWVASTNFKTGACGVIKATKALGYKVQDVKHAFKAVKIDTSSC